jgi:N-acetylmuramoyl-L-alanine amidase
MRPAVLLALTVLALHVAPARAQRIVLDPGHGGSDPGAVGCGLQEATVVLDIANRTATLLRNSGFTVDMTRSDDRSVSLSARTSFANSRGADRFVSIHANANAGTPATGTETFAYTTPGATSLNLRDRVQEEMIAAWGLRNRGGKLANFHVLRETSMPAALSETAFINNCTTDARYLGDATRRGQMAEAHYRAIMRHYGRTPGSTTPPPPSGGTLRGVTFEDTGRGLEDTSVRIGGVAVALDGRAERATSESPSGAWSFNVPAGSYTVVATLAGYGEGRRTCDVAGGGETWCSVGLRRDAPPPPPPPPPVEDAGAPEVDAGSEPVAVDAAIERDAGTPIPSTDAGDPGPDLREATAGGCSVGTNDASPSWLLLLAFGLAVGLRRRAVGLRRRAVGLRRRAGGLRRCVNGRVLGLRRASLVRSLVLASLALFVLACGESAVDAAGASLRGDALDERDVETRVEVAREVSPFAALHDVRALHPEARFVGVEIAPTGDRFAVSEPGFASLAWTDGTALRTIAQGPARGFAPVWRADGLALGVRTPGQSESAVPHLAYDLEGQEVAPIAPPDRALAWVDAQDRVVVDVEGARHEIRLPGDRPFAPVLSPDRRHVIFRGLSTGLYARELATGRTIHLGEGGHPRFDASSRYVVFERVLDDGHEVTSATLWIADLARSELAPLTSGPALATSPSLATDGTIAWLEDEVLQVARLAIR